MKYCNSKELIYYYLQKRLKNQPLNIIIAFLAILPFCIFNSISIFLNNSILYLIIMNYPPPPLSPNSECYPPLFSCTPPQYRLQIMLRLGKNVLKTNPQNIIIVFLAILPFCVFSSISIFWTTVFYIWLS